MEPHPQPSGTNLLRASETRTTRGSSGSSSSLAAPPTPTSYSSRARQERPLVTVRLRPGTIAASSPEPHNYKRSSPQPKKFDVKDGQQVSRVASSSTSLPIPLRLGTDVFVLEYVPAVQE